MWIGMNQFLLIGKKIEIDTNDGKINGEAIKLDYDGGLIVKSENKTNKIISGDIIHLSK